MRGTIKERSIGSVNFPINLTSPTKKMIAKMNVDQVYEFLRRDSLIMKLAQQLTRKGEEKSKYRANTLRELSRLVLYYNQSNNTSKTLQELIDPLNYKSIVKAVNEITDQCAAPGLALRLGHALNASASILFTG